MKSQISKREVIYEHPDGRFEVIAMSGVNFMGDPFCYHEAVYTPKRDKRGIAHDDSPEQQDKIWTSRTISDANRERIRAMCREGLRAAEIAKIIGCSTQSVRNITRDLRESKVIRRWTDEEKENAIRLYENGYTYASIGEKMGRHPASVRSFLINKGVV